MLSRESFNFFGIFLDYIVQLRKWLTVDGNVAYRLMHNTLNPEYLLS